MPEAPDAGTIHPAALRAARKRQNMTQQQLADAVGCTKDTVSRWERGASRRVRSHLREPLRIALRVREWEKLTKPPERTADTPQDNDVPNHTWIKFLAEKDIRTGLQLVTLRYGVHPWEVLKVAPLLFLIVAEHSLLERRKRLRQFEEQFYKLDEELSQTLPHLDSCIAVTSGYPDMNKDIGWMPLNDEADSIKNRDVFGRQIVQRFDEDEDAHYGERGPFVTFLRDLAKELPNGAITSIESSWDGDGTIHSYRIADDTLRECTGISENDEQGENLLDHIRMGRIDLAACLRVKHDRDDRGYRQWLSDELVRIHEEFPRIEVNLEHILGDTDPSDAEPPVTEKGSDQ